VRVPEVRPSLAALFEGTCLLSVPAAGVSAAKRRLRNESARRRHRSAQPGSIRAVVLTYRSPGCDDRSMSRVAESAPGAFVPSSYGSSDRLEQYLAVRAKSLFMARPAGLEPATYCLEGSCSIR
jgi:hypothetical protein